MSTLMIESWEKILTGKSVTVHVRNSILIKDFLNCDFITHYRQVKKHMDKKYDNIIICYGAFYFRFKQYYKIVDQNKDANFYWLVNEYNLSINSLFKYLVEEHKKKFNVISINSKDTQKTMFSFDGEDMVDKWYIINLNCLIFNQGERKKEKGTIFGISKEDCIYYGTFRQDRINTLLKYNSCPYVLSIALKNSEKFKKAGVTPKHIIDTLGWIDKRETLSRFKYCLYIEDDHTAKNYSHMANRFYECLMCDVLLFYDRICTDTVTKSGYDIDDFQMVSDGEELKKKIKELDSNNKKYKELLERQRGNFEMIEGEQRMVRRQLKKLMGGTG